MQVGATQLWRLKLTPISFSNTKGNQRGLADQCVPPGNWSNTDTQCYDVSGKRDFWLQFDIQDFQVILKNGIRITLTKRKNPKGMHEIKGVQNKASYSMAIMLKDTAADNKHSQEMGSVFSRHCTQPTHIAQTVIKFIVTRSMKSQNKQHSAQLKNV